MNSSILPTAATSLLAAALFVAPQASAQGARPSPPPVAVTTVISASPFDSTLARLERAAVGRGLNIAAKVDHAAAAQRANLKLRPTTLVIAGNPAAGTPLMQADQTMGVELPLRFLVWQGEDGKARVSYEPIRSIAGRHAITGRDELLGRMTGAIEAIVAAATVP